MNALDLSAARTVANSLISVPNAVKTATATASSSSSSTTGSDISSSDFLTLLVTEMKNQDPTQPTDPNAYIQQLVGVNSLQQLISINQELGTATSGGSTTTSSVMANPVGLS